MRRDTLSGGAEPNFIGCWVLEDEGLCDRMVAFFEANGKRQAPGRIGSGQVDGSRKQSTDMHIRPKDLQKPDCAVFSDYMEQLHACFRDHMEQWVFLKTFLSALHVGGFNLQKY